MSDQPYYGFPRGQTRHVFGLIVSRTAIKVKPSRFCPVHLLISYRSISLNRIPQAQIKSLCAHSTRYVLVKWFCVLFGNQFKPDDVYDHYPADRLMVDIPIALMAMQTATTEALSEFPMKPTATEKSD